MDDRPRLTPRTAVRGVELGIHGGTDSRESREIGIGESDIMDFSASVSPYGPSPKVIKAVGDVDLSTYPDPGAPALAREIAAMIRNEGTTYVGSEQVIVTAGSVELLSLVASAYLEPGRTLLTLSPYFGEYHPPAQTMGAKVESFPIHQDPSSGEFSLDTAAFVDWIRPRLPAVIILNDPHNPTGLTFGESLVRSILDLDGELILVVDEAYRDFMVSPQDLADQLDTGRLILMRSLTKAHALAGIRLGYGVSSPEIIDQLRTVQQPWTVSSVAQAAGSTALSDSTWLKANMDMIKEEKQFLLSGLASIGLKTVPSSANFFLIDVSEKEGQANVIRSYLLRQGIRVRSCASFGLPDHIRISPRKREDNEYLLKQLRSWVDNG